MQPPSGGRPFVFVLTRAALGRRTSRRIRAPPRRMPRLLAQLRWLAFGDSWFKAKRSKYPPTSRWGESPRTATRSPGSRRRAAHPSARRSHPHTRRCAAGRDRRLRSVAPGTQPQPPHKLHTPTAFAGLCGAHTQWALLVAGERHRRPQGGHTAQARHAPPQRLHGAFPCDSACPQPTTAWHTLRRTLPPETHARTRARRPRRGVQHKHEPSLPTIQRRPRTLDDS